VTNLAACMHIMGEVDVAAEDDLARVMTHQYIRRRRTVYIDLDAVTFAGSTPLTFIACVYPIGGERSSLIV
jgi:anti-anti-sigma regulatory factor